MFLSLICPISRLKQNSSKVCLTKPWSSEQSTVGPCPLLRLGPFHCKTYLPRIPRMGLTGWQWYYYAKRHFRLLANPFPCMEPMYHVILLHCSVIPSAAEPERLWKCLCVHKPGRTVQEIQPLRMIKSYSSRTSHWITAGHWNVSSQVPRIPVAWDDRIVNSDTETRQGTRTKELVSLFRVENRGNERRRTTQRISLKGCGILEPFSTVIITLVEGRSGILKAIEDMREFVGDNSIELFLDGLTIIRFAFNKVACCSRSSSLLRLVEKTRSRAKL